MVVRESVIFGIPLDPNDPSNNAMAPVSGISQGQDIDFDDQEELVYWVQSPVSPALYFTCFLTYIMLYYYYYLNISILDEKKGFYSY